MEQEILEELEKLYKDFKLEVNFIDFRLYEIVIKLKMLNIEKQIKFNYKWDVNFTKSYNISIICYNIDKRILSIFKKENINE